MKKLKLLLFIGFLLSAIAGQAQTNSAFDNNMKEVEPGVWAIYSGDIDQDGFIDLIDQIMLDNDISSFASGYIPTDLNGDGYVDLLDQIILDNNLSLFIYVHKPE